MRLVSFRQGGRCSFGAAIDDTIADLGSEWPTLQLAIENASLTDLKQSAQAATIRIPAADLEYLPPITHPDKIICVGLNYRGHAQEVGAAIPAHPSLFVRFSNAHVGHGWPIWRPSLSDQFDFEGELAIIIGKPARHVPAARALEYVAGYSCFADNSARDYQRHATQATAGKNFQNSGAFGPSLTTADEIPDPSLLTLVTRLNGEEVQRDALANLIFPVPELIAYISGFAELAPGDVIATGTPAGVGVGRTPPLFMRAGDTLEVEIPGVGVLRNPIIEEPRH